MPIWNHKNKSDAGTTQGANPSRTTKYPQLYIGAPLDVLNEDGGVLFSCRLAAFNMRELQLERMPGALSFPLLNAGASVRVRGFTADSDTFVLQCTVRESSRTACTLVNLELIDFASRRTYPRQPIGRPAEVLEPSDKSDVGQECLLVDIGMGGACIRSKQDYAMDKEVRLRVELYKRAGYISFISQIVRKKALNPSSDGYEYGLLFAQMSKDKARYLAEDIRVVQEEAKRKARF